jgi:hypothetical protein
MEFVVAVQPPLFLIHQGKQLSRRLGLASIEGIQNLGDVQAPDYIPDENVSRRRA